MSLFENLVSFTIIHVFITIYLLEYRICTIHLIVVRGNIMDLLLFSTTRIKTFGIDEVWQRTQAQTIVLADEDNRYTTHEIVY